MANDQQAAKTAREEEQGDARAEIERLEEGEADQLPSDVRDWPGGKAKFLTFGRMSDAPYGEGPTAKLGPPGVVHHEGGSVSVGGEMVDDPERFKGEPIPGGPTDPNSPTLSGEGDRPKRDQGPKKSEDAEPVGV